MHDSILNAVFTVVEGALDLATAIDETKRLSRTITGSDKIVDAPSDPKPLPPTAHRALAEASQRERAREQAAQAASGTDQAS